MIITKSEYGDLCRRLNLLEEGLCRANAELFDVAPGSRNWCGRPRRLDRDREIFKLAELISLLLERLNLEVENVPGTPPKTVLRKREKK